MEIVATPLEKFFKRAAYALVALAAVGIASPYEHFVRLHLGPFHILEALLACWLLSVFLSRTMLKDCRVAWPAFAFLCWGLVLALRDAFFRGEALADPRAIQRFLQHSVLYVYPFVWMAVGIWLARMDRAVTALVMLLVLAVNTAPNFLGSVVANESLGPLTAIVLAVCVDKAMSWPTRSAEAYAYWLVSLALGLLTFLPYWSLWFLKLRMQRTSLLILLVMLVATPLLRRKKLSSLKNVLITVPLFVIGFFVATAASHSGSGMSITEHLADNVVESLDKYGGYLDSNPSPLAMVSVRKFWWRTAVDDWRSSPVTGVGFIPEVPSRIGEGLPNDWATVQAQPQYQSEAPISGPHNSYLTILARTGLVGLAIFLVLVAHWLRNVWPLVRGRELNLYEIMVIMMPIAGAIHAFLNIGLETPRSSALLWLFAGAATVYAGAIADAEAAANSRD